MQVSSFFRWVLACQTVFAATRFFSKLFHKNDAQEEFGPSRFLGFLEKEAHLATGPLLSASLAELTRWSKRDESAAREDDIPLIAVDLKQLPPAR
ncbi:MAG TPA: hypothetical protein VJN92_11620 [Candidatus Acidoferrum sp.]|nr:hypothetical protein [Candidatus Acidoferrum sp.]